MGGQDFHRICCDGAAEAAVRIEMGGPCTATAVAEAAMASSDYDQSC